MALDTYANLQTEIASWLRRDDLTAEIPSFIALAQAQMNRKLRCRRMMARATLSITGQIVAAPADFLAPRSLRLTGTSSGPATLEWVSDEQMDTLLDSGDYTSGQPRHYTLEGGNFRFSPDPGSDGYTAELSYYAAIPALSDSNPSNWVLATHPDAYLYGALTQSAPYLKADERLSTWSTIYRQIVDALNATNRGEGGRLMPIPSTLRSGGTP